VTLRDGPLVTASSHDGRGPAYAVGDGVSAILSVPRASRAGDLAAGIVIGVRRPGAVAVTVDLYGGSAATVQLAPRENRWPDHETRDRLDVSVGFAAVTLLRAERSLTPRIRHRVMSLATALLDDLPAPGAGSWSERVAGRRLVGSDRPGGPRITARLVAAGAGPRVVIDGAAPTALALSAATSAVAAVALRDTGRDVHLAAALALEGVLLWCAGSVARRHGPRRAVDEGYRYAVRRLADVRVAAPEALQRAVTPHGSRGR
jgi:hypothetical protein